MIESRVELLSIEQWFVERGVPHFVEGDRDNSITDTWARAFPLLIAAYFLLGFQALDLYNWTLGENLLASILIVIIAVGTWVVSNRIRGMSMFARPEDIDAPELALFLVGPTLPPLLFGQFTDAVETVLGATLILVLIYVWSGYGLGPLTRWAFRKTRRQLGDLVSLVARALPLLLLFNAFLFINAEVWEVAGTLDNWSYWVVIGTFFLLGAVFAVIRVPAIIRDVNAFSTWDEIAERVKGTPAEGFELPNGPIISDQPRFRQRVNIALLVLYGQALQITLVALALTLFFIGFGFAAISQDTVLAWTRLDDIRLLWTFAIGNDEWILSDPLLRVATFLGAFSGMYFTVVLTTDDTYRTEFADEVGPAIREALAVRTTYRVARGTHPAVVDGWAVVDNGRVV